MKLLHAIQRWFDDRRHRRLVHQIARHYHGAGALSPYAAAAHEMFLRRKLGDFQCFASRRYIEDRSLILSEIKQEWLDLVVKPMARSEFTREDAKCLKAAIAAITHRETFVGAARDAYQADIQAAIASAKSGSVYKPAAI